MKDERKISNILVTGGAGFIGSAFIRHLLSPEAKFQGKCLNYDALTYAGNLENLSSVSEDPRYFFEKGDINDKEKVIHLCQKFAIDTIIHFAAESHVDRSILGPEAFVQTNIMGTFRLLEAVKELGEIHFHHVSTDEVFGALGPSGYFTEESPYQPNSPYSASKASSDFLVRSFAHTYNISTCISNCSNNYGPYHFPEKLIPLMILNALENKPLPVYGTGGNIRDWLYVEDHAKALYLLLKQGRSQETYLIGGDSERTNLQVVDEILNIFSSIQNVPLESLKKQIVFIKDRPGHDWRYAIDHSKITKELGWRPEKSFSEGLKETISWYLEHKEWTGRVRSGAYQEWMASNYSLV